MFKFTGKERDAESGNDYFGARYYGSSMGRFMSPDYDTDPDTVPYADFTNPQSLNLYSYVNNNPLTNTDPDGHDCIYADGNGGGYVKSGDCYSDTDSGVYVDGTIDVNSFQYNAANNSSSFSYTPYDSAPGTIGTGVLRGPDLNGGFDPGSLGAAVFGSQNAGLWNSAAGTVNTLGGIEMGALSIAMPELLADTAVEGGLTGGAKLGEAAANRMNHIFQAKHKLDALIRVFGSKQGAYEALISATERAVAGSAGPFEKVVQVGGQSVTVRGAVINGAVKISTAFVR